jgi:DNA polymerase-3 subunit alpha
MIKILLIVPDKNFNSDRVLREMYATKSEVDVCVISDGPDVSKYELSFSARCDYSGATRLSKENIEQVRKSVWHHVEDKFVNLHHHDEYSLKDGLGTVEQHAKVAKAQGRGFVCVTNHGSVGGWIRQYNVCRKEKLKPIFGMEAYVSDIHGPQVVDVVPEEDLFSGPQPPAQEVPPKDEIAAKACHMIMLARNEEGFSNIIRMHNDAQLNGFYYNPRVCKEAMKKWGKGVIVTTACLAGLIPRLLEVGRVDDAKAEIAFLKGCFDEVYVEIQLIEYEPMRESNRRLIKFAKENGFPIIMAIDSHYLEKEQSDTQDLMLLIRQGKTMKDKIDTPDEVWNFEAGSMYYRNYQQLYDLFKDGFVSKVKFKGDIPKNMPPFEDDVFTEEVFVEACMNTRKIATMCEDVIIDSSVKLPKLYADSANIFREKLNFGFSQRGLAVKKNKKEYIDRLNHEYNVIKNLGWTDYFLVMEKIIDITLTDHGEFSVGRGRGSAAGSLVAYCLRITDVDPIEHGLLFERFLDESRMGSSACKFEV